MTASRRSPARSPTSAASPAAAQESLLRINADQFASHFTRQPFLIGHSLAEHPLFQIERILKLAQELPLLHRVQRGTDPGQHRARQDLAERPLRRRDDPADRGVQIVACPQARRAAIPPTVSFSTSAWAQIAEHSEAIAPG